MCTIPPVAPPGYDEQDHPVDLPTASPLYRQDSLEKTRMAEDAWNTRDPARVPLAHAATTIGETAQNF
jgi:nuclear transport factor 2 (NTF2) superfamily protein